MIPFLIVSLPRSRTSWLSVYFSTGGVICYHERLIEFPINELLNSLGSGKGNADSSLCLYPDEVLKMEEEGKVKIVVVDRNVRHCLNSLSLVYEFEEIDIDAYQVIARLVHGFEKIKRFTKGPVVPYERLDELLPMVHQYVTPQIHYSAARHKLLAQMNITQKIKERMNYAVTKLKNDANKITPEIL